MKQIVMDEETYKTEEKNNFNLGFEKGKYISKLTIYNELYKMLFDDESNPNISEIPFEVTINSGTNSERLEHIEESIKLYIKNHKAYLKDNTPFILNYFLNYLYIPRPGLSRLQYCLDYNELKKLTPDKKTYLNYINNVLENPDRISFNKIGKGKYFEVLNLVKDFINKGEKV